MRAKYFFALRATLLKVLDFSWGCGSVLLVLDRQKLIVCSLAAEGAVVNATADLADLFARRRRAGVFAVPVSVVSGSVGQFKAVSGFPRLPFVTDVLSAARVFGDAPVESGVREVMFRELRRLGARAAPLVLEWQRAVDAVKGVAV